MSDKNIGSITLDFPFEYKGENYKKIGFRRPRVGDLKAMEAREDKAMAGAAFLMARLAERDVELIDMIDAQDFLKVEALMDEWGLSDKVKK